MSFLKGAQKTDYGSHFRAVKEATTEPAAVKWFLIGVAVEIGRSHD